MAYAAPTVAASSLTWAQLQANGASGFCKAALATQSSVPAKATELMGMLFDANKSAAVFERLRNLVDANLAGKSTDALTDTALLDYGWVFGQLSTAITEMAALIDAN